MSSTPFAAFQPYLGWGDFSDLYLEESASLALRWEGGKVESLSASEQSGVGLRSLHNFETRFGHTDVVKPLKGNLSRDERERLDRIHKSLVEGLKKNNLIPLYLPLQNKIHAIRVDPRSVPLEEKIKLLERAFGSANSYGPFQQISINYGEKTKKIATLNSLGETFTEERVYLVMSLTVTVARNQVLQTAYDSMGGLVGFELFDGDGVEKMAAQVAGRALKKLEAPLAPVGAMPVVIASSAGGTLIHEAVGHSLELDAVWEGTSPSYKGKLGKVVGPEKLNVFDDPTVPNKRGSYYFDDEGTPSERTHLIENGILKNYLTDRLSAKRSGLVSNGHGRRESFAFAPIPRMSNTFVGAGPDDPDNIVNTFQKGLLVIKMGGGQVNTANGDFVFDVEEGFSVTDGKKTLVRGATLLGNGPQVLLDMEAIGSDQGWAIGTCGKEGQGVPVSDALPTVRIKTLVVGGSVA